jgi:hypothetical protein
MKHSISLLFFGIMLSTHVLWGQTGTIIGTVRDKETQKPIFEATVALEGTSFATTTDSAEGKFKLENIPSKSYNMVVQLIGYQPQTVFNIVVTSGNAAIYEVELERSPTNLKEVVVRNNTYGKRTETPLSVQSLSAEEIRSNPGGNFDISKVIQALPGVGGTGGNAARNDLIIRGGSPSENVYYLDGVEVPQINHFSTQGASGGPQGILNVSFIEDVSLATSSFGAKYDNALSSVLQFKQRDGNPDKLQGNLRLSSTEIAATLEGPIDKKTTFLASARRSYLQYFFQLIDLPIRPNYWDFQYKVTHKLNEKTTLTAIGLGAIDDFSFAVPKESTPTKEAIIRQFPTINQWNYTTGFTLKRLLKNGFMNVALSRNMFENRLDQFEDAQTGNESKRTLKSQSQEIENKLRIEVNKFSGKWRYSYGVMGQYVKYNNDFSARLRSEVRDTNGALLQPAINVAFNSAIDFWKYGVFGSVSRKFAQRLSLTLGARTDMNTFTSDGNNPISAFSPRFTASYAVSSKLNLNATVGRYAKIPVYTVLGFADSNGRFVNKDNKYIICDHFVTGVELLPNKSLRITAEGFYKQYSNYPVSVRNGVSLANQGADFGAVGNEQFVSSGKGRAYGIELFLQQKLVSRFFLTASYTLFKSEFSGANGKYVVSAWDNNHLLSLILGRKFNKGWEFGAKYRLAGGAPYTPYDLIASRYNYAFTGRGVDDNTLVNSRRLPFFNQLDIRIDKKINYKRSTLNFYIDFQNFLFAKNFSRDTYAFERNKDNTYKTTDGRPLSADGSNAIPLLIRNVDETVTPAIGIIFSF